MTSQIGAVGISSYTENTIVGVAVGGAGAQTFAAGGSVSVNEIANTVETEVENGASVTGIGAVTIQASDQSSIIVVAGAGAGAQTAAIGASAASAQLDNTIKANVDDATVTSNTGDVSVLAAPTGQVKDKHVLVIDGVLDTGRTMARAAALLRDAGAASVRTAVAVDKHRGDAVLRADHALYAGVTDFIVGYGMDDAGRWRALPYIGKF